MAELSLAISVFSAIVLIAPAAVHAAHSPQEIAAASTSTAPNAPLSDATHPVIKGSITLPWRGRIIARAVLDIYESGTSAVADGLCFVKIDSSISGSSDHFELRYTGQDANVQLLGAKVVAAGTHTVKAMCQHTGGPALTYNRGDLELLGIKTGSTPKQVTSAAARNAPDSDLSTTATTEIQKSISIPWSAAVLIDSSLGFYVPPPQSNNVTVSCAARVGNNSVSPAGAFGIAPGWGPVTPITAHIGLGGAATLLVGAQCTDIDGGGQSVKYRAGDLAIVAVASGSPNEVRASTATAFGSVPLQSTSMVVMTGSISLPWRARIVADAVVQLGAAGSTIVWVATCQLFVPEVPIGQQQFVEIIPDLDSSGDVQVPLAGSAVLAVGQYDVQVACSKGNDGDVSFQWGVLNLIAVRV